MELEAGGTYTLTISGDVASEPYFDFYAYGNENSLITATIDASAATTSIGWYSELSSSTFLSGSGNDYFRPLRNSTNVFDGGGGYNRVSLYSLGNGVTFDLGSTQAQDLNGTSVTIRNINDASGTAGADTITGTAASNWNLGNGGNELQARLRRPDLIVLGIGVGGVIPVS